MSGELMVRVELLLLNKEEAKKKSSLHLVLLFIFFLTKFGKVDFVKSIKSSEGCTDIKF